MGKLSVVVLLTARYYDPNRVMPVSHVRHRAMAAVVWRDGDGHHLSAGPHPFRDVLDAAALHGPRQQQRGERLTALGELQGPSGGRVRGPGLRLDASNVGWGDLAQLPGLSTTDPGTGRVPAARLDIPFRVRGARKAPSRICTASLRPPWPPTRWPAEGGSCGGEPTAVRRPPDFLATTSSPTPTLSPLGPSLSDLAPSMSGPGSHSSDRSAVASTAMRCPRTSPDTRSTPRIGSCPPGRTSRSAIPSSDTDDETAEEDVA